MKNNDLPLNQCSIFSISKQFEELLNPKNRWAVLAHKISWEEIESEFEPLYASKGRPAKPIRLMVGLLLIKQILSLSDEETVRAFPENPYWQCFCGLRLMSNEEPCHPTESVKFRQRIGEAGAAFIFRVSVKLHGKEAEEKRVQVDTTVQEKNVTYPTDSKLYLKIMNRLHKTAKAESLVLRRSFTRELKHLRLLLRNFRHPKCKAKARKALRRLRTIAGKLLRDVYGKLSEEKRMAMSVDFELWTKILEQKRKDKNKTYSLHEPDTQCIGKGKAHKACEFGKKVSAVKTEKSKVIVGVSVHEGNPHDSKTLDEALKQANSNRKRKVVEAVCDRGYRGAKTNECKVMIIPSNPKKRDSEYQKRKQRSICQRRASIEPVIGHLKSDFGMGRSFLKGHIGDTFNALTAGCARNLKLLWRRLLLLLFFIFLSKKEDDSHYFYRCSHQF